MQAWRRGRLEFVFIPLKSVCVCVCVCVVPRVTQLCLVSSSSRNTERVSFVSVLHWLPLKTQHTGHYSHSAHTHTQQERTDLTPLSSSLYATSLCPSFSHSLSLSLSLS